jgi:protein phosphatase PTC7
MADRITEYARACMFNLKRVSPFEKAARKAGKIYRGGKVDECVLVFGSVVLTLLNRWLTVSLLLLR